MVRLRRSLGNHHLWLLCLVMAGVTFIYYADGIPFIAMTLEKIPFQLTRRAMQRTLFVLPVAYATLAFGMVGGLITLFLAFLIMMPRVLFVSLYPLDAFAEVLVVCFVGGVMSWVVESLEKERWLRQKAVSRLTATNAISEILNRSLELEEILDVAMEKVLEMTGLDAGHIFVLDEGKQELNLAAHRGISPQMAKCGDRLKVGEGFCGRVAQTGEPLIVENTCRDERCSRVIACQEGFLAQLVVPLRSKGKVKGTMALARRSPRQFVPEEIALISTLGNQIGVAIENALLHEDVARQLETERRLNEVAQEITSEIELSKVLPKILRIAEALAGADGGAIALFDEKIDELRYPYVHGVPEELTKIPALRGKGLAWEVIERGQPLVVEDYPHYPSAIKSFVEAGVKSVLGVPLVSVDKVFGQLGVFGIHEKKSFTERDVALLCGVGRLAGIAIENARLYQNMRFYVRQITQAQEAERERIARELHDDTAQALLVLRRHLGALMGSAQRLPESAVQRLEQTRQLTDEILEGVRRFSQDLRPPTLDDLGLLPTLEGLVADLKAQEGIDTRLEVLGSERRLSREAELVLFRIAQEALNNVRRHAQASKVVTTVEFADGRVRLTVSDNGRGVDLPGRMSDLAAAGKLGLMGMHERARLIGGVLMIQSEVGKGTTVIADLPV